MKENNFQFSIFNFQSIFNVKILKLLIFGFLLLFLVVFIVIGLVLKTRETEKNLVSPTVFSKKITSGFKIEEFKVEPLNIEKIFSENHDWTATLSAGRKRTLIVTGDIILGRMVNYKMVSANNFKLPFEKTAGFLKTGDLTIANLESPLVDNCLPTSEGMVFCGDKKGVSGLSFSGIDVVSLTNNHIANYGAEGITQTISLLEKNGISYTGVSFDKDENLSKLNNTSNLAIKEVKGLKFGFLGYNLIGSAEQNLGISWADPEIIKKDILEAKGKANIIIVMFHWGEEYTSSASAKQRELARLAIDNGVDLVLGNHPHWVQGVEIYQNKMIAYSHGNFIFDQEWSRETKEGVIGRYTFYDKELVDAQFFPILIEDYNQPKLLYGEEARKIIERMKESSIK